MGLAFRVLGEEAFGVVAMITTLITFVILSELGVGPGLTNVLSKSIAADDMKRAGVAFSTAFFLTVILAFVGCLAVLGVALSIPVDTLFGEKFLPYAEPMQQGIILGVGIIFLKMITSLGDRARAAYQETFVTNLYGALGNLTAGIILIAGIHHYPKIWFVILVVNGILTLAALANLIHFWIQRPHLIPRVTQLDRPLAKFLISDGLAFCATLSLAPIAKDLGLRFVLAHLGGPAAVAVFDILERLMVIVFGFIVMFTFPLWPALSDAAARRDFEWIRAARQRLYGIVAVYGLLFTAGLTILGPWAISLWLGEGVSMARLTLFAFSLYVSVHVWHHVHHIFLAGLDSIRLVAAVVLIELPFFVCGGYFGYTLYSFPGLFFSLALVGLIASVVFPYLAFQRTRTLERDSTSSSPQITGEEGMITAAS
ncbi:MAG: O-antigen/teichoic acid export membrane protein [Verrucomicrobiales bacterium]|jgi:O-antigen/teichoic acid export membrane protein